MPDCRGTAGLRRSARQFLATGAAGRDPGRGTAVTPPTSISLHLAGDRQLDAQSVTARPSRATEASPTYEPSGSSTANATPSKPT
jgi:hypothetical protein